MLDPISSDLETQVMRKEKRKEQAAHGVPRFGPLPIGLSPQDGWEGFGRIEAVPPEGGGFFPWPERP